MKLFVAKNLSPGVDEIHVTMSLTQRGAELLARFLGGSTVESQRKLMDNNHYYKTPATSDDLRDFCAAIYPLFDALDDVARDGQAAAAFGHDNETNKLVELIQLLAEMTKQQAG